MAGPGIVEVAVAAVLPDLAIRIDELARRLDELIPAPPMLEAIAIEVIGILLERKTLTITTSGEITLTGHKGAHPDDVRKD